MAQILFSFWERKGELMPRGLTSVTMALAVLVGLSFGETIWAQGTAPAPAPGGAQTMPAPTAAATPAPARLDDILARRKLRVGTTGDYPPFTFLNKETGKFEGHDIDVATSLGKAMGAEVEFVHTSWPTLSKDFAADKFDVAVGGVSITLQRQMIGFFSTPIMREGKTPITRCPDVEKFDTIPEINQTTTRVIVNPGGTNERFARGNFKAADIRVHNDNVTIFKEIAEGKADVMVTDASETRYQQKLHPGVLCAVHPEKPFDFSEKAYWLQRDVALKAFVDQWLHISTQTGEMKSIYAKWFE
jgi:cyclohexadienyl dehydratase